MRLIKLSLLLLTFSFIFPSVTFADWPMAGHDPQRTSYSAETTPSTLNTEAGAACWTKQFADYIPSKAPLITADLGTNGKFVYVPTSAGLYALNGTTGAQVWFYALTQPIGHAPTVDKTNATLYIPSLDKTIHKVNAVTGAKIWQTGTAGGGFLTNPLVANNLVYAGNRDGYLYAFNTTDGAYAWSFATGGPVDYSPAISLDNQTLYFASHDAYAYALNAINGTQKAKSVKFQGHGFYSFWPVVHTNANRVLFPRSLNYPDNNFIDNNQRIFPPESSVSTSVQPFVNYHNTYPDRRTLHVLNSTTLAETETAPYMWWGNPNGNRYPPAIDNTGKVWALSAWFQPTNQNEFPKGRYMGWVIGAATFTPEPNLNVTDYLESTDEPEAIAIFGNSIWHGDGGDGADKGGMTSLTTTYATTWDPNSLYNMIGGSWYTNWNTFRYGNGLLNQAGWAGVRGTHGNQNPPVPLNGKAYIHRSNTVICLQP